MGKKIAFTMASIGISMACLLSGCSLADSQLRRGPNGEPSALEQEVRSVAPAAGPWGALAIALATAAASAYGAFHAREANKQTDRPAA